MEFEEFRRRVRAERNVRAQRDAAERRVPGERLRRAIREAFASKRARELAEDRQAPVKPNPIQPPDAQR
jgi:hypothetical protein